MQVPTLVDRVESLVGELGGKAGKRPIAREKAMHEFNQLLREEFGPAHMLSAHSFHPCWTLATPELAEGGSHLMAESVRPMLVSVARHVQWFCGVAARFDCGVPIAALPELEEAMTHRRQYSAGIAASACVVLADAACGRSVLFADDFVRVAVRCDQALRTAKARTTATELAARVSAVLRLFETPTSTAFDAIGRFAEEVAEASANPTRAITLKSRQRGRRKADTDLVDALMLGPRLGRCRASRMVSEPLERFRHDTSVSKLQSWVAVAKLLPTEYGSFNPIDLADLVGAEDSPFCQPHQFEDLVAQLFRLAVRFCCAARNRFCVDAELCAPLTVEVATLLGVSVSTTDLVAICRATRMRCCSRVTVAGMIAWRRLALHELRRTTPPTMPQRAPKEVLWTVALDRVKELGADDTSAQQWLEVFGAKASMAVPFQLLCEVLGSANDKLVQLGFDSSLEAELSARGGGAADIARGLAAHFTGGDDILRSSMSVFAIDGLRALSDHSGQGALEVARASARLCVDANCLSDGESISDDALRRLCCAATGVRELSDAEWLSMRRAVVTPAATCCRTSTCSLFVALGVAGRAAHYAKLFADADTLPVAVTERLCGSCSDGTAVAAALKAAGLPNECHNVAEFVCAAATATVEQAAALSHTIRAVVNRNCFDIHAVDVLKLGRYVCGTHPYLAEGVVGRVMGKRIPSRSIHEALQDYDRTMRCALADLKSHIVDVHGTAPTPCVGPRFDLAFPSASAASDAFSTALSRLTVSPYNGFFARFRCPHSVDEIWHCADFLDMVQRCLGALKGEHQSHGKLLSELVQWTQRTKAWTGAFSVTSEPGKLANALARRIDERMRRCPPTESEMAALLVQDIGALHATCFAVGTPERQRCDALAAACDRCSFAAYSALRVEDVAGVLRVALDELGIDAALSTESLLPIIVAAEQSIVTTCYPPADHLFKPLPRGHHVDFTTVRANAPISFSAVLCVLSCVAHVFAAGPPCTVRDVVDYVGEFVHDALSQADEHIRWMLRDFSDTDDANLPTEDVVFCVAELRSLAWTFAPLACGGACQGDALWRWTIDFSGPTLSGLEDELGSRGGASASDAWCFGEFVASATTYRRFCEQRSK